jgi:hypothetical protein
MNLQNENCPCCRHEANSHERLPYADTEDIGTVSDLEQQDATVDTYNEGYDDTRELDDEQNARYMMAAFKFQTLRRAMTREQLEDYAATRINSFIRGCWGREIALRMKMQKSILDIQRVDLENHRRIIKDKEVRLRVGKIKLGIIQMATRMSRGKFIDIIATKIQAAWRGYRLRNDYTMRKWGRDTYLCIMSALDASNILDE